MESSSENTANFFFQKYNFPEGTTWKRLNTETALKLLLGDFRFFRSVSSYYLVFPLIGLGKVPLTERRFSKINGSVR